jgi:predicted acylesterase/phospholipase RssA
VCIEPEIVSGYPDRIVPKRAASAAKTVRAKATNLYNQRSQWSIDTHRDLDAAVAAGCGWPADITTAKHRSIELC